MSEQPLPPKYHELVAAMSRRIGREAGVRCKVLAEALGIPEREVRTLVTLMRERQIAVCGKPHTGYFIAANKEELEETCAFLRARAMNSLRLEAGLRRVPLADLVGQLKLPT